MTQSNTMQDMHQSRLERQDERSKSENDGEQKQNVGFAERLISAGAGGLLLLNGFRKRSLGGAAMMAAGAAMLQRGMTGHCSLYDKLGIDHNTDHETPEPAEYHQRGIHVAKAYTIANKSPQELFKFWRNFENFPSFMTHIKEVKVTGDKTSHWKATGPAGMTVEWDAQIINEEPDKLIAWQSQPGADVHSKGSVRFVDTGGRGTQVRVNLDYIPPAGRLSAAVAFLFGQEPRQQIQEDLRHFKQLMEMGEVATNEGPQGNCKGRNK